jgi:hypothetical protein
LACVYNKTRAAASLVLSSAFGQEAQVLLFECPRCSPDVNRELVACNGLAHRQVAKDGILRDGEKQPGGRARSNFVSASLRMV